jgi:hypothetical protein
MKIQGFLSRCNERNPTECEFKRREFALPTVCSRSDEEEEFQITNVMHEHLRKLMKDMLLSLKPPIECPVIKKVDEYRSLEGKLLIDV